MKALLSVNGFVLLLNITGGDDYNKTVLGSVLDVITTWLVVLAGVEVLFVALLRDTR